MKNRIIFIATPMGTGKDYVLNNADELLQLSGRPRIFFKFGALSRVMPDSRDPFPRIQLTVTDHDQYFQDRVLIYYGWEIVECLDRIKNAFPHADFFLSYVDEDRIKENIYKKIIVNSFNPGDKEQVQVKIDYHYSTIKNFIERYNGNLINLNNSNQPRRDVIVYGSNG